MGRKSKIRLFLGLALFAALLFSRSVLIALGYDYPWRVGEYGERSYTVVMVQEASISQDNQPKEYIPPEPNIILGSPETLKISESTTVLLKFEPSSDMELVSPISSQLFSSSFDVAPKDKRSSNIVKRGPTVVSWVATPKKEGEHSLLMEIAYKFKDRSSQARQEILEITKNLQIEVNVVNILGITPFAYRILTVIVSLSAFALLHPYVVDTFNALSSNKKKQKEETEKKRIIKP